MLLKPFPTDGGVSPWCTAGSDSCPAEAPRGSSPAAPPVPAALKESWESPQSSDVHEDRQRTGVQTPFFLRRPAHSAGTAALHGLGSWVTVGDTSSMDGGVLGSCMGWILLLWGTDTFSLCTETSHCHLSTTAGSRASWASKLLRKVARNTAEEWSAPLPQEPSTKTWDKSIVTRRKNKDKEKNLAVIWKKIC